MRGAEGEEEDSWVGTSNCCSKAARLRWEELLKLRVQEFDKAPAWPPLAGVTCRSQVPFMLDGAHEATWCLLLVFDNLLQSPGLCHFDKKSAKHRVWGGQWVILAQASSPCSLHSSSRQGPSSPTPPSLASNHLRNTQSIAPRYSLSPPTGTSCTFPQAWLCELRRHESANLPC